QARATAIDLSSAQKRSAAMLSILSSKLDETEVRAPVDGVVLWRGVERGEQVTRDQQLFRVGDTRDLIIESYVDEADVARVSDASDGRARSPVVVSLYAFSGKPLRGQVVQVMPDAQRERKAFLVKLRLDAPPQGLRSGMSAEINILTAQKDDAVVVPSEAVRDGAVWVVRGGRVRRVAVTVGVHDLLRTEIVRGVGPGDLVVTDSAALADGRWVSATVQPMDHLK